MALEVYESPFLLEVFSCRTMDEFNGDGTFEQPDITQHDPRMRRKIQSLI